MHILLFYISITIQTQAGGSDTYDTIMWWVREDVVYRDASVSSKLRFGKQFVLHKCIWYDSLRYERLSNSEPRGACRGGALRLRPAKS